jgi:hypothetical protein
VGVARRAYRRAIRLYWSLRAIAIVSGVSIAAIATTPAPKWILGILGALGAGAEAVLGAANLQERAVIRGLLADQVSRELREYTLGVGVYADGDTVGTLYSRIEALRDQASSARFRLDRTAGEQANGPKPVPPA